MNNAPLCADHRAEKLAQSKGIPKLTGTKRPRHEHSVNMQRKKGQPIQPLPGIKDGTSPSIFPVRTEDGMSPSDLSVNQEGSMKTEEDLQTEFQARSANGDQLQQGSVTNNTAQEVENPKLVDWNPILNRCLIQDLTIEEDIGTVDKIYTNLSNEPPILYMPDTSVCATPGEQTGLTLCEQVYLVQFFIPNCATDFFVKPSMSDHGPDAVRFENMTGWAKQNSSTGSVLVPPNFNDRSLSQQRDYYNPCSELTLRDCTVSFPEIHAPHEPVIDPWSFSDLTSAF